MLLVVVPVLLLLVSGSTGLYAYKPSAAPPKRFNRIVLQEDFDSLDLTRWTHLVTAWRGGNDEFQYYRNNRSNSYVRDGVLYIRPTLTASDFGDNFLQSGSLTYPGCNMEPCTSTGGQDIVQPIQSARIYTKGAFSFKYGRIEVRAKMPRGDWIWPAIWMMPEKDVYGGWPRSGEIDLVESRGNDDLSAPGGPPQGVQRSGHTLHWGPDWSRNGYAHTAWEKFLKKGDFADSFHVYALEWTEKGMKFTIDGEVTGEVSAPQGGFWKLGEFDKNPGGENIWANGGAMAPFDQDFHIILNVAVGGKFFGDDLKNRGQARPWDWGSGHPMRQFWDKRDEWLATWKGEDAAMQIDYIHVYQ